MAGHRIGIDFGGTKIEIAVIAPDGMESLRRRVPTPADYPAALEAVAQLVLDAEAALGGGHMPVGIGIPGVISPVTGLVKNSSKIALNGHPFDIDISGRLAREVRVENDANCFTLREAADGAGAGYPVVFGVIQGTGCGGGIVAHGRVLAGHNKIAGEWGHTPLPWPRLDELPGPPCWCGQWGCLETFISGTGFARDCDGPGALDASTIPERAAQGDPRAVAAVDRHLDRLARGLVPVVNILDPDCIVLGGGLSNMPHLYERLPALLRRRVFTDVMTTPVLRNKHGDSSGVRGAAWLWPA
jgi:fructokinase